MRRIAATLWHEETTYHRHFDYRDHPGAGFSFECDDEGNVDVESLNPAAADNYRKCLDGTHDVIDCGVEERHHSWKEPAVWICCETEFTCDHFTNTCPDCQADYNSAGQRLADRSQWGEETGESLADILRIP